mgnify:CR=1 FL=1
MSESELELFRGVGIEVKLNDSENFLKIKETLTRIGVGTKDYKLYQSCHILHKRDSLGNSRYSIVHFKEMFKLDGKSSSMDDNDISRRNFIAKLLQDWGLVSIINYDKIKDNIAPISSVKIIAYKDKDNWDLISKYQIGRK